MIHYGKKQSKGSVTVKKTEFSDFAARQGWKLQGNTAFGVVQNYPFRVIYAQNGALVVWLRLEDGAKLAPLVKALNGQLKGVCSCGAVNGSLTVTPLRPKKERVEERLRQGMDTAVAALREAGIRPPSTCPLCKQGSCDCVGLLAAGYVPVHRSCLTGQAEKISQQTEENMATGSYVTGFVGAILGGLVGTLPSLLSILLIQRIFVVLYALIPLAAFQGYKLFKGRMDRGALLCSVISGLLNLFSLNFLVFVVQMIQTYGALPADYLFLTFFSSLDIVLPSMVMDFIFLALGIWFCYGRISQTGKKTVSAAQSAVETLQPYGMDWQEQEEDVSV